MSLQSALSDIGIKRLKKGNILLFFPFNILPFVLYYYYTTNQRSYNENEKTKKRIVFYGN